MSPEEFQKQLEAEQAEKSAQANEQTKLDAVVQSGNKVVKAVNSGTKKTASGLKNVKGQVKVTNPDLAKTQDVASAVEAINKLNLTTFMQNEGLPQLADNLSTLSTKTQELQNNLENQGLQKMSDQLGAVVKKLDEVAKTISNAEVSVDSKLQKTIDNLSTSINKIDFKPSVNVSAPDTKVVQTPVDLSSVVDALGKVETAVKESEIPETEVDLAPVTAGLKAVQTAITSLRFPVPNYESPFRGADGKGSQMQMDSFGRTVTVNNASRDLLGSQTTTITSSTSETTIITAATSTYNDLLAIFVSNTSATGARVDIRDTTGGTVIFQFYVPPDDVRGISLSTAWPQTAVNSNWTAQSSASVADLRVSALFIKNR